MKRLLAGLLAVLMIFSLFGCAGVPAEAKAYIAAVKQLEDKGTVTMDILQKTTTEVGGSTMTMTVEQELTYNGLNTQNPIVQLKETFPDMPDEKPLAEVCNGVTVFTAYDEGFFSGQLTKAEIAKRYLPVGIFEAKRYRAITQEQTDGQTLVHFTNAKSAEIWAMPTGAKLVSAAGTAKLDKDGALQESQYVIIYENGAAKTTLQVVVTLRQTAETVTIPTETDKYKAVQYIDGPRALTYAKVRLALLPNGTVTSAETRVNQVTGDARIDSQTQHLSQQNGKVIFATEQTTQHSGGVAHHTSVYKDGTWSANSGFKQTGMTDKEAREIFTQRTRIPTVDPKYWEDITVTNLGGVMLVEFLLGEAWDSYMQRQLGISEYPAASASGYEAKEMTAYLAVNSYTGAVTGAGYKYAGAFTHNGQAYIVSEQLTQGVEFPAPGAYKAITGSDLPEQEPEDKAAPLFYKVTGENGQQMWLLGTIHIGDARTAYLPKEIKDALAASDALALEMDAVKFEQDLASDATLQQQIREAYNYTDGSKTADHLDAGVYDRALKIVKASGNYTFGADTLKVAIWENVISNFHLQVGSTLTSSKGVEMRLTKWAQEMNKPIREVESGLSQIQMLTGWSEDLQAFLMSNTLSTTPQVMGQSTEELYELWCAGNEKALRNAVGQSGKMNFIQKILLKKYIPLLEEYNKGMNFDRNAHMLEVAKSYLESGDTVFYAVGLAHLLDGENGLVDTLREAGYTVEQVKYA